MPIVNEGSNLADDFADHFMGKIETNRESLKDFENFEPTMKKMPSFDVLKELSEDEIKKLIGQSQTKSSELDVLPTKVLKGFLNELLPSITRLVNLSPAQGVFPKIWKKGNSQTVIEKIWP